MPENDGLKRPQAIHFIASYPKSGSTFLRFLQNAYHFGKLEINSNINYAQYDNDILTHHIISPWPLTEMAPETALYLRHAALLYLMCNKRFPRTMIKTHNARMVVGDVALIPRPLTAGAIYIVRDPRDVVTSFSRHMGWTVEKAAEAMNSEYAQISAPGVNVAAFLNTWSYHVNSWADCDDTLVIRYEDLKTDTANQFKLVLEQLMIEPDRQKIREAVKLCDLDRLMQQEEKKAFIEKGKAEKFFGQGRGWRAELDPAIREKIEHDHRAVMQDFGYL